ncbi:MAG: STAS domain-containing protein [Oceanococcaceae bacterium]
MSTAMSTLSLPAQVTIRQAAELKEEWLQSLQPASAEAPAEALELDAAAIEKVDGTGLALLLSLQQWLKASGRSWAWKSPSAALLQAAAAFGVAQHLQLPPVEHTP